MIVSTKEWPQVSQRPFLGPHILGCKAVDSAIAVLVRLQGDIINEEAGNQAAVCCPLEEDLNGLPSV